MKKNNAQDFIDRLKGVKEVKEGKRLSVGYLNKAVKAITRVGNLSNKTNYKYEDSQVTEIYHTLMSAVTVTMSRFGGVDEAKERYERLIAWDIKLYQELQKSDPLLYEYIEDHFNNSEIGEYLKEKGKTEAEEVLNIQQKISSLEEQHKKASDQLFHLMEKFRAEERNSSEILNKQQLMMEKLDRVLREFNLLED